MKSLLKFCIYGFAVVVWTATVVSCHTGNEIIPGAEWKDTDSNVINAHGADILYHNSTY